MIQTSEGSLHPVDTIAVQCWATGLYLMMLQASLAFDMEFPSCSCSQARDQHPQSALVVSSSAESFERDMASLASF